MMRKWMFGVLIILMAAGCAAPQPVRPQATPTAAAAAPAATATRVRQRPTQTPEPTATQAPTAMPTVAPTTAPTVAPTPSPTATTVAAAPADAQPAPVAQGVSSGVVLRLDPNKYPAPALLAPDNGMTYHVAQPVAHLAWSATPTDLVTFGQTAGCVSDETNFRRMLESYQLVIHSLDVPRADQVQWTQNATTFDLNLTTVPQGRYSWSVRVVAICESYVVGQRDDTKTHKSTTQYTYLAPISATSGTRLINWVP